MVTHWHSNKSHRLYKETLVHFLSHHLQCLKLFFVLFCFNLFLNEGQLLYNVLLVSAVERESAMSIHISPSS